MACADDDARSGRREASGARVLRARALTPLRRGDGGDCRSSRSWRPVPSARLGNSSRKVGNERGRSGPLEQNRGIQLHAELTLEAFGEIQQHDRIETEIKKRWCRVFRLPAVGEVLANGICEEAQHRIASGCRLPGRGDRAG